MDEDLQRVGEKLRRASLRLNQPLAEAAVVSFEQRHNVSLPDDYRRFATQLGDGGAGPYHGLLPLERWADALLVDPRGLPPDHLARPSRLVQDQSLLEAEKPSDEFHQGTIAVAVDGCGYFTLLLVSGPDRGRIVGTDACTDVFVYGARSFVDWYETWLDDWLGIRTSAGPWFEFRKE